MSNQITVIDQVKTAIIAMGPQFKAALPAHVSVEKFNRVVMTSLQMNGDLLNADRKSLYMACSRAAQMGLLPDGREGAIVAFGGKAQFMPMVAGIMRLVRNSGEISTWSVQGVHENDEFSCVFGDEEHITHVRAKSNRGKLIGAYSIVTMKDGEKSREYMDIDEIEAIRARSRSGNAGPWKSDFEEMAKKTVIRRHSKRLPMSTDLDELLRADDEQFMPAEPDPVQQAQPQAEKARRGASRLATVAEQAPPEDATVIEGDAGEPEGDGDSPI
jgi:recombination protein RecT